MNIKRIIKMMFTNTGVDKGIYICTFILCVFGVVMIGDASVGMVVKYGRNYPIINMLKQCFFLGAGAFFMAVIAHKFNTNKMLTKNFLKVLYFGTLFAMFACLLWSINGAHGWIKLGPITIQPAEFMKIVIILLLAYHFGVLPDHFMYKYGSAKHKAEMDNLFIKHCVAYPVAAAAVAFFVCAIVQKDLGSGIILAAISIIIFFCVPLKRFDRIKVIFAIAAVFALILFGLAGGVGLMPHQLQRFESWLNPLSGVYDKTWQIVNGFVAYSNGGLFGLGFGNSIMKYGYIPESQNDFISAIIVEEFGLFGFALLMIPYFYIIFKIFKYGIKNENIPDRLILIGISSYFFLHLFVNIGGVSGLIPMTGVPLIFISAGGSSTLAGLMSLGIAQSIIKRYNRNKLKKKVEDEL